MSSITWLHLSDLHYEKDPLNPFWGTMADLLLKDLKKVCDKSGPPDVIFFTGDFVWSGYQKNFKDFSPPYTF
ncbi:MAG: metallophosphoesterase [Deltaproteobacteria bacterium]|nr:metallophosphoesterase [Deltaproteobacteria bacterium]